MLVEREEANEGDKDSNKELASNDNHSNRCLSREKRRNYRPQQLRKPHIERPSLNADISVSIIDD